MNILPYKFCFNMFIKAATEFCNVDDTKFSLLISKHSCMHHYLALNPRCWQYWNTWKCIIRFSGSEFGSGDSLVFLILSFLFMYITSHRVRWVKCLFAFYFSELVCYLKATTTTTPPFQHFSRSHMQDPWNFMTCSNLKIDVSCKQFNTFYDKLAENFECK